MNDLQALRAQYAKTLHDFEAYREQHSLIIETYENYKVVLAQLRRKIKRLETCPPTKSVL